jgi:hypothetical protein
MDNFERILFLVFGITIGAVVVIVLTRPKPTATYALAKTYQNEETWDMWEDEQGHIHTIIHRKVNAVD